jgi:anthranilate synthase component 1
MDTPDILLLHCEELAVIDNLSGRLYLIVYADPTQSEAYFNGQAAWPNWPTSCAIRSARRRCKRGPPLGGARVREGRLPGRRAALAKDYIAAGDMMQVQIGQRLKKRYTESPLSCTARCAR